jgi:hypothetical protein
VRTNVLIYLTLGIALSGCSAATQSPSVVPAASSASRTSPFGAGSKPIVAPTYIYFEYVGETQTFEVYGRKKSNQGRWTSKDTCKKDVKITFAGYNAQGSSYVAKGRYPGAYCAYSVTNPHGKQGTVEMYVSSD